MNKIDIGVSAKQKNRDRNGDTCAYTRVRPACGCYVALTRFIRSRCSGTVRDKGGDSFLFDLNGRALGTKVSKGRRNNMRHAYTPTYILQRPHP